MTPGQQWFYMQELKRKTAFYESDQRRVEALLQRAQDDRTRLRLKRELQDIENHLNKLKRGLLYG
jgi:hypothetical protein